jgi:uncharacterized protein (DUF2147 family)
MRRDPGLSRVKLLREGPIMSRAVLIASAVAAVLATPALAAGDYGAGIDEKCYGVAAKDVALCGAQDCSSATSGPAARANGGNAQSVDKTSAAKGQTAQGQNYALVPQGTCLKLYGGSLFPQRS